MEILVIAVIAGLAVLVVCYFLFSGNTSPYMRQVPRKEITDVMDREYVETYGKVIPIGKTLIAPLSGLECVYYCVEIWKGDPNYNNRSKGFSIGGFAVTKGTGYTRARVLVREHSEEPFYIEHNGAKAAVSDPLQVLDKYKMIYESGLFDNPSPNVLAYLQSNNVDYKTIFGIDMALFCYEWIIPAGCFITLKGKGYWKDADKAGLPSNTNRVLSITKGDKKYIYVGFL
ncbi:hypothetical protein ACLI1A_09895 [Flavobacterium sp. RHBU_3]|uniref:hypothetical protein n=1 Tax=Flavobacterium sp. RHBU_3 TaxID=3391184 RepID=UPI003984E182